MNWEPYDRIEDVQHDVREALAVCIRVEERALRTPDWLGLEFGRAVRLIGAAYAAKQLLADADLLIEAARCPTTPRMEPAVQPAE